MSIKDGDFVKLEYNGRIQSSGLIFSTTDEESAKKADIYDDKTTYRPVFAVVGKPFFLSGLDRQIKDCKIGETRKIIVPAREGYGEKDSQQIETYTIKRLKKSGIKPVRGAQVRDKQRVGRILSVKEGKARVDYNHPLAGSTLEFEVTIIEKLKTQEQKIFAIIDRFIPNTKEEELKYEINKKEHSISIELQPFLLISQGAGEIFIRLLGEFREFLDLQKIEFKFPFDFSQVKKAEDDLSKADSKPNSSKKTKLDEKIDSESTEK